MTGPHCTPASLAAWLGDLSQLELFLVSQPLILPLLWGTLPLPAGSGVLERAWAGCGSHWLWDSGEGSALSGWDLRPFLVSCLGIH